MTTATLLTLTVVPVLYTLFDDAPESEERELTTFAGQLRATVREGMDLMIEIQSLENPLAEMLLQGDYLPGDTISIDVRDGELVFQPAVRAQEAS